MLHRIGGIRLVAVIAVAVLALGAWAQSTVPQTSAADDPQAALDTFIAAVNADDGAAMVASFTPDGYFEDIDPNGTFGIFGTAALQLAFGEGVGTHVVMTDSSVSGNTVSGTVEVSDDGSREAGVDRYLQTFVATADGNKLASFVLHYDTSDSQTATVLQYEADSPDEGEDDPPEDAIEVNMGGNQAGQAGIGTVSDGVLFTFIEVASGPDGVEQPAAIRSGTCDHLGDVTQWLAPLMSGNTGAALSMSMDDLASSPHAFTVSDSQDNPNVIVSCANIEEGAAPPPTGGGTQLPDTGSGGSDGGDSLVLLLTAVAALGAVAVGGGVALRRRRA